MSPTIPEGARVPQDHQSQIGSVKPTEHAVGWELLRPPIDLEFWEITEFLALSSEIKVRGDQVELNSSAIRTIGKIAKMMQTELAVQTAAFKAWLREGDFEEQATKLLPLIFEYAGALGEVESSASN